MDHKISFRGVVRLDENKELICFCYQEDVENGLCKCLRSHDCPEAVVEICVIAGTKPSEKATSALDKTSRDIENSMGKMEDSAGKIKQGLSALEKAIKKNTHFRI